MYSYNPIPTYTAVYLYNNCVAVKTIENKANGFGNVSL